MTYAPKRLLELHEYLKDKTSVPANAVGIVGNPNTRSGGYHCGKDRTVSGDCSAVESSRDRRAFSKAGF